jgi:hypothetical protein
MDVTRGLWWCFSNSIVEDPKVPVRAQQEELVFFFIQDGMYLCWGAWVVYVVVLLRNWQDFLGWVFDPKNVCSRPIAPVVLDTIYTSLKTQVIKAERRVLKELGFCVHVKHPHKV